MISHITRALLQRGFRTNESQVRAVLDDAPEFADVLGLEIHQSKVRVSDRSTVPTYRAEVKNDVEEAVAFDPEGELPPL